MSATFTVTPGTGENCGPSFLRASERKKAIEDIKACGSVELYRSNLARKTIIHNKHDKTIKPASVRSTAVYNQAMSSERKKKLCP